MIYAVVEGTADRGWCLAALLSCSLAVVLPSCLAVLLPCCLAVMLCEAGTDETQGLGDIWDACLGCLLLKGGDGTDLGWCLGARLGVIESKCPGDIWDACLGVACALQRDWD